MRIGGCGNVRRLPIMDRNDRVCFDIEIYLNQCEKSEQNFAINHCFSVIISSVGPKNSLGGAFPLRFFAYCAMNKMRIL